LLWRADGADRLSPAIAAGNLFGLARQLMTAARLPMIITLVDPVATATAVSGLCAASVAGARTPLPALDYRRSCDAARPRFAGAYHIPRALPLAGVTATLAALAFNSP
jgi:hypothetical protein